MVLVKINANVCITKCNLVSSHWPFHPYVLILYSFLQLYLFDPSTIACLKFPSGCEITGWPRRFIPVFLGAYQSARINFDILTFTYDYVYNFNLYFARASEGIHLGTCVMYISFKILVKKKIWWKTSLDILKKIEKSIVIGLHVFLEAHTHLKFIIIEKNLCANAMWKKENKVNLELQSPLFIVLFDYLNQLMKVKLTIKVEGRSECLIPIKPVFVKKSVTEYGKVINSYILIYSLQNWWNFVSLNKIIIDFKRYYWFSVWRYFAPNLIKSQGLNVSNSEGQGQKYWY